MNEASITWKPYDPATTYKVGDRFAHPLWGDCEVYKVGKRRVEVTLGDRERFVLHSCTEKPEHLVCRVHDVWHRNGSPRERGLVELAILAGDVVDLLAMPGPGVPSSPTAREAAGRLQSAIVDLGDGTDLRSPLRRRLDALEGEVGVLEQAVTAALGEVWSALAESEIADLPSAPDEIVTLSLDQVVGVAIVHVKWNDGPRGYRALAIWGKAHGKNPRFIASIEVHRWTRGGASMLIQAHERRRTPEMLEVLGADWIDEWTQ